MPSLSHIKGFIIDHGFGVDAICRAYGDLLALTMEQRRRKQPNFVLDYARLLMFEIRQRLSGDRPLEPASSDAASEHLMSVIDACIDALDAVADRDGCARRISVASMELDRLLLFNGR